MTELCEQSRRFKNPNDRFWPKAAVRRVDGASLDESVPHQTQRYIGTCPVREDRRVSTQLNDVRRPATDLIELIGRVA